MEGVHLELSAPDVPPTFPVSMHESNVKREQHKRKRREETEPGSTTQASGWDAAQGSLPGPPRGVCQQPPSGGWLVATHY